MKPKQLQTKERHAAGERKLQTKTSKDNINQITLKDVLFVPVIALIGKKKLPVIGKNKP